MTLLPVAGRMLARSQAAGAISELGAREIAGLILV